MLLDYVMGLNSVAKLNANNHMWYEVQSSIKLANHSDGVRRRGLENHLWQITMAKVESTH